PFSLVGFDAVSFLAGGFHASVGCIPVMASVYAEIAIVDTVFISLPLHIIFRLAFKMDNQIPIYGGQGSQNPPYYAPDQWPYQLESSMDPPEHPQSEQWLLDR
ncbi:hypothetical protein EJB05_28454, partial [Eragrostis curvula]